MSQNHQEFAPNFNSDFTVRQNRFNEVSFLYLLISGKKTSIKNYSTYGLAFVSEKEMQADDIVDDLSLFVYDNLFLEFTAKVKRCAKTEDGKFEIGLEFYDQSLDVHAINNLVEINSSIREIYEKENKFSKISKQIKEIVHELAWKFSKFSKIVSGIESSNYENTKAKSLKYQTTISMFGKVIYKELQESNAEIQKQFFSLSDDEKKNVLEYYRDKISEFSLQSSFANRSFTKPRGYAGDFEMMNQLYRNDDFSNTLFGNCVERAVNLHAEPTAVRNRSEYLSSKIINTLRGNPIKKMRVLAVACGPAEEVTKAIRHLSQTELDMLEIDLLDQDMDAILYAQKNIKDTLIETKKNLKLNLINKSIKEIITSALTTQYDLIYSAGLFDYFSDAVANRAMRSLLRVLNKNGRLIIGNFNIASPNWFGMLALFDWFLILRSEDDLKRIFKSNETEISIEAEKENVNLFCNITKK